MCEGRQLYLNRVLMKTKFRNEKENVNIQEMSGKQWPY